MEHIEIEIDGLTTKDAKRIAKQVQKRLPKELRGEVALEASEETSRGIGLVVGTVLVTTAKVLNVAALLATILGPVLEEVRERRKAEGLRVTLRLADGSALEVDVPSGTKLDEVEIPLPTAAALERVHVAEIPAG